MHAEDRGDKHERALPRVLVSGHTEYSSRSGSAFPARFKIFCNSNESKSINKQRVHAIYLTIVAELSTAGLGIGIKPRLSVSHS
jgi:hypothetical protein